jgi:DNA polymerase-3 subunit alpha
MIPLDRGLNRSIHDCVYGNEEKDYAPIIPLIAEIKKHDNLLNVALSIEGLVNKRSVHASGVYIFNTDYNNWNAMMKSPSGQPTTQFDMNDSDFLGGLKFDFLTISTLDKIRIAIDMLVEHKLIKGAPSIRKTYDKYFSPDVINTTDSQMWEMAAEGDIQDLFQFNTSVGEDAIRKVRPESVLEAAAANSLMRLMADRGDEQAIDRFVRHKKDINIWYREMNMHGITESEVEILKPYYLPVYGVPNTQEDMMLVLMDKQICNFDIVQANFARKVVAKKKISEIDNLKSMIFEHGEKVGSRKEFIEYVWNTAIKPQLG